MRKLISKLCEAERSAANAGLMRTKEDIGRLRVAIRRIRERSDVHEIVGKIDEAQYSCEDEVRTLSRVIQSVDEQRKEDGGQGLFVKVCEDGIGYSATQTTRPSLLESMFGVMVSTIGIMAVSLPLMLKNMGIPLTQELKKSIIFVGLGAGIALCVWLLKRIKDSYKTVDEMSRKLVHAEDEIIGNLDHVVCQLLGEKKN